MLNALEISKKNLPYRPFYRAIDRTLKIPEKCWSFLYLNSTRAEYSSALPAHAYKMVTTTVCVQMDMIIRELLCISVRR